MRKKSNYLKPEEFKRVFIFAGLLWLLYLSIDSINIYLETQKFLKDIFFAFNDISQFGFIDFSSFFMILIFPLIYFLWFVYKIQQKINSKKPYYLFAIGWFGLFWLIYYLPDGIYFKIFYLLYIICLLFINLLLNSDKISWFFVNIFVLLIILISLFNLSILFLEEHGKFRSCWAWDSSICLDEYCTKGDFRVCDCFGVEMHITSDNQLITDAYHTSGGGTICYGKAMNFEKYGFNESVDIIEIMKKLKKGEMVINESLQ